MHNGPNETGNFHPKCNHVMFGFLTLVSFYTLKTKDDHEVSLTDTHNILIYIPETNVITFSRASKVTSDHRLLMLGRKVKIKNISIVRRRGFHSPLSLTGYLFVNISILPQVVIF